MKLFLIILSATVVASKSIISQQATKNVFTVKKNETVSLKCPISTSVNSPIDYNDDLYDDYQKYAKRDNQILIVQWYKDGNRLNKLTLPQRYSLNNFNNADLNIQKVTPSDAGDYKCKIINGFGSVSHSFSLIVSDSNGIAHYKKAVTEEIPFVESKYSPPVFSNPERMIERSYQKTVGAVAQFVCDSVGIPKPDILWFKNGEILSEEDYGITRSKWQLNLKDIRLTDSGNYSCQVFNKMGYINATYKLSVIAPETVSYQEPVVTLNTTIIADMDAILECKIKHSNSNLPSVKWMKQITKSEYDNYVSQNNLESAQFQSNPAAAAAANILNNNNELKNFYQTNTKSPLYWPGLDTNDIKIDEHSSLYSLNDLIGSNQLDNHLDNIKSDDLLKIQRRSVEDDSVHYITLTSSPSVEQKLKFNRHSGVYISQLKIKQATVKDSGVYVCFLNGNTYAKANLNVLPNHFAPTKAPGAFPSKKNTFIAKETKIGSFQSFGLLVVLIPVLGVVLFALASICYLKSVNKQGGFSKTKKTSLFFCCLKDKQGDKLPHKNYYNSGSAPVNRDFYNQQIQSKSDTGKTNNMSFSDTSSTTATTVPYYATVPLLESSPPPPLPNSQPPTKGLERCDSTPSMAYYKIVDSDIFNHEQLATLPVNECENQTSVSGSSRVYYQLAPTFTNSQRAYNQSNQQVFNPNIFI